MRFPNISLFIFIFIFIKPPSFLAVARYHIFVLIVENKIKQTEISRSAAGKIE